MKSLYEKLLDKFRLLQDPDSYTVAYSGGLDSTVLLHLVKQFAAEFNVPVSAIHINHGLSQHAGSWERHCQNICKQLKIPLQIIAVDASIRGGESPEAAARVARYAAFEQQLQENSVLLLAQHQDDQAETLLLQLLRGAGPKGLASMPAQAVFGKGQLFRPLLDVEQSLLAAYAEQNRYQWIDDDSNDDLRFDRNFLRHQVLPLLRSRWPAMSKTVSRSARLCAQADEVLTTLGDRLVNQVRDAETGAIDLAKLSGQDKNWQALAIRTWLAEEGYPVLSHKQLQVLFDEVIGAAGDSNPVLAWADSEIRRYQGRLYVMQAFEAVSAVQQSLFWLPGKIVKLNQAGHVLEAEYQQGAGVEESRAAAGFEIRFRDQGEQCIGNGGNVQSLKKLLQNLQVPPWERGRIPLVIDEGRVIAIGDRWVSPGYRTQNHQWGYKFKLSRLPE